MIDEVLARDECDDDDLYYLPYYRPELAGSPEKFFRILDKIRDLRNQECCPRGCHVTCSEMGNTIWLFHL